MDLQEHDEFTHSKFTNSKINLGLVTVITVVYNGEKYIQRCISSVINQTYPYIEYIIIDGDSKDRTLEILNKNKQYNMHIISEKDYGIYDAMNKGINLARGEWIYFLGADDRISNENVIKNIFHSRSPDVKIIYGNIIYDNSYIFRSHIDFKLNISNKIHHQSAFYHASLFAKFRYNNSIKIVADYELNYIIYLNKYLFKYVDLCISICGSEGVSRSKSEFVNYLDFYKLRRNYIGFFSNVVWFILGLVNLYLHPLFKVFRLR